jgi:hypothetical protein
MSDYLITTFEYDAVGEVSAITDPQGIVSVNQTDQAGRPVKQIKNAGVVTQLGVDADTDDPVNGSTSTTESGQLLMEDLPLHS